MISLRTFIMTHHHLGCTDSKKWKLKKHVFTFDFWRSLKSVLLTRSPFLNSGWQLNLFRFKRYLTGLKYIVRAILRLVSFILGVWIKFFPRASLSFSYRASPKERGGDMYVPCVLMFHSLQSECAHGLYFWHLDSFLHCLWFTTCLIIIQNSAASLSVAK